MLKKTIKFVDFNGKEAEETVYFNMSKTEAMRYDTEWPGGLEAYINSFDPENNPKQIREFFERLVLEAYGEKSSDGRHFLKSEESRNLFSQSRMYDEIVMELLSDADNAVKFFEDTIGVSIREASE